MIIRWLEDAIDDLHSLRCYIAQDNPRAAQQVVKKILLAVARLAEQPALGRLGRVMNTRELIVANTPYIVPYQVRDNTIEILRVLHVARQWPDHF